MLEKTFRPAEVEAKHYDAWEKSGAFAAHEAVQRAALHHHDAAAQRDRQPAHGPRAELHASGHPDPLSPHARRDALWQPGTDHAGIATQMVVERAAGRRRARRATDLGRAAFIDRVWQWKAESGGTITRQLRRLGASPDWAARALHHGRGPVQGGRARSSSTLHKQGLIYRDKRLVNWDPKLHTAISDLEVESRKVKRAPLALQAIRWKASRISSSPSRRPGRRPCWATPPSPCIRKTSATRTWSASYADPAAGRPPHPDRRRRICRSGDRQRRGQDHPGPRLQRFRGRPPATSWR